MVLNPNCSEAVMRIRTDKMTSEKKEKLLEELKQKFDSGYNSESYETYVTEEIIFGIPIIKISGAEPHNNRSVIEGVLDSHKVSNDSVEVESD